jgi:hypothetical protein
MDPISSTHPSSFRVATEEGKLLLTQANQWKIIKTLQQASHLDKDKTYQMAQKLFTGKSLQRTVQQVIRTWEMCQKKILIEK